MYVIMNDNEINNKVSALKKAIQQAEIFNNITIA